MKINPKTTTFTPVGERPRNSFGWQTLKPLPDVVDRLWTSGKIVLRITPASYKHGQTGFIDFEDGSYVLYVSGEPFELAPVEVNDGD